MILFVLLISYLNYYFCINFQSERESNGFYEVSGCVTREAATGDLTSSCSDEDETGSSINDNSGAILIRSRGSFIQNIAQCLQFWGKKHPEKEKQTVTFTNISTTDQIRSEESVTSVVANKQNSNALVKDGEDKSILHQEPKKSIMRDGTIPLAAGEQQVAQQGHSISACKPNIDLYSQMDSNMALSELPASFHDETDTDGQRGESVNSYIQMKSKCSTNESQVTNSLLTRPIEKLGNTDFVAMRVEQESFGLNAHSNLLVLPGNPANVKKNGVAVLDIDTSLEVRDASLPHKNPEIYVHHSDIKGQVFAKNNCSFDSFQDGIGNLEAKDQRTDLPGDSLGCILSGVMEEAALSQLQQSDNSMSDTDEANQVRAKIDYVALNLMTSNIVKDDIPNLMTSKTSSIFNHSNICSTSPSVIDPTFSELIPGTSVHTNSVSTTNPMYSVKTSTQSLDPPYVSCTDPSISNVPHLPITTLHTINPTNVLNTTSTFNSSHNINLHTSDPTDKNPSDSKGNFDSHVSSNSTQAVNGSHASNTWSSTPSFTGSGYVSLSETSQGLRTADYVSQAPSSSLIHSPFVPHIVIDSQCSRKALSFSDPPYVSNSSPSVSDAQFNVHTSPSFNDPPYVSNTSPSVNYAEINAHTSPSFSDPPYVSNTSPSVRNGDNNSHSTLSFVDPPYISNTPY